MSPPKQPVRGLKKVEGGVGLGVGWGMGDGVGGFGDNVGVCAEGESGSGSGSHSIVVGGCVSTFCATSLRENSPHCNKKNKILNRHSPNIATRCARS
mmetsp:Transcript_16583/g.30108  ORF Transcript_16583/g.30108 Transcript_16583/m.30108 type:complete len:97 (+) Transcript_16583:1049-1339(+)